MIETSATQLSAEDNYKQSCLLVLLPKNSMRKSVIDQVVYQRGPSRLDVELAEHEVTFLLQAQKRTGEKNLGIKNFKESINKQMHV